MTDRDDTATQLRRVLDQWAVPPPELVGKRPVNVDRDGPVRRCDVCGGTHRRAAAHLDYLGHAVTTRILCEVDPLWSWEPVAFSEAGEPLITRRDSTLRMWIRLTLHGVSRLGVGTCDAGKADAEKELIGDAIRNAAMRFGVGLSLWAKEDWASTDSDAGRDGAHQDDGADTVVMEARRLLHELDADTAAQVKAEFLDEFGCRLADLPVERHAEALAWIAARVKHLTAPMD